MHTYIHTYVYTYIQAAESSPHIQIRFGMRVRDVKFDTKELVFEQVSKDGSKKQVCVCVHVCMMYVCMYVCMYIYAQFWYVSCNIRS